MIAASVSSCRPHHLFLFRHRAVKLDFARAALEDDIIGVGSDQVRKVQLLSASILSSILL
jgi:hypothetical protein